MKPAHALILLLLPLALPACSREEAPPPAAAADTITPALEQLAERAKPGTLGVLMLDLATNQGRGINIDRPLPMQSVFKLPLGIFVLALADQGKVSLDEKITLTKDQLSIAHSPIAEKFEEKQDYTIAELVRAAVAQSDNTAADVLLKRVGGPQALTRFFQERGVTDFRVDRYESELQPQAVGLPPFTGQWTGLDEFLEAQEQVPLNSQKAAMTIHLADPRDRISARAAVEILALLDRGKLLSPESTEKMLEIMRSTSTGADRLKAGAPKGATVYHKTGTGPSVDGRNSATNDIGIIELPGGRRIAVAALLSGSELPPEERAKIIAEVGRIAATELAAPATAR
ncbi:MAG TPA: class A beta-lactamase [Allosphingosinicella sp.]|nr:class A beta-lactamase [Allosphingosinicella sp.]